MRTFIATWKGIALGFLALLCLAAEAGAEPRNVILLIGDGMGPEQVKAAGMYAYGAPGTLLFESLPRQGQVTTYSADNAVTDSAAAATAIATGIKVNNGVISMAYPGDGSELQTLLEHFKARGKSTGLVTTVYITHATPAGFGAHEPSRNNLTEIGADYLGQTKPNVILGGGANGIDPTSAENAGYTVVTDRNGLLNVNTEGVSMLSGQFGSSYLPYEYDGGGLGTTLPHLFEMTDVALRVLDNDPDGFFLMVEGGKIDEACHANDRNRAIGEVLGFEDAFAEVLDWAMGRDDTLVIVTADHETGGLGVTRNNGQGVYPDVSWTTTGHSAANVPVYAWGPGSDEIFGTLDNTDFFAIAVGPQVELVSPPDGSVIASTSVGFTARLYDAAGLQSAALYVGTPAATEVVTFSGSGQVFDVQIEADRPDTNLEGDASLAINIDGLTPHAHGVLKVPGLVGTGPGQIPAGATIVSAALQVNCSNPGNLIRMYRLAEDWVPAQVTWNQRASGIAWADAGADGGASIDPAATVDANMSATGWRSLDVTRFVQDWADGDPNYGIVMVDTGQDGVDFYATESGTPPVLTVEFSLSWQQVASQSLGGATSANVAFAPQTLADGQEYLWNVLATNSLGRQSWAAATAGFAVDTLTAYPAQPAAPSPADGATGVALSPTLSVQVSDPDSDPVDVTFYGRGGNEVDEFTIVVLPDTQNYTLSDSANQTYFRGQTQWIANNLSALNVVFVTHVGDITNDPDTLEQWTRARGSMDVIHGLVPYAIGPGNHDVVGTYGSTTYFNDPDVGFPYSRYTSYPWYGDHYSADSNENSYQLFSAGGDDYLILHLAYNPGGPTAAVLSWANGVLQANASRKAIITTHSYMDANGTRTAEGTAIWNNLVLTHDNVFLVLCGHLSGEGRRTDVVNGRNVHQLLADFQDRTNGGDGWLRVLRFAPAEDLVRVETYSPVLNNFEVDASSKFTLELPMTGARKIGTVAGVSSGSTASIAWAGLAEQTRHDWFVRIADLDGNLQVGPTWTFRTGNGDMIPPVISIVEAGNVTDHGATITWTTDEPADSLVEYWTSEGPVLSSADAAWVTGHSVELAGLTPGADYTYRVTSKDSSGNSATSGERTFRTDSAPIAQNQEVTVGEDGTLPITLLATDPDPGAVLTYAVVAGPSHGTLTGTAPDLTYTPAADYDGSDSFTFKANDGIVDSNVAMVSITVTPVNDPPVAVANSYSVDQGATRTVAAPGILGNDTDPDTADTLTAVLGTGPTNGTLTLYADGSFTYLASGAVGTESFTYQARDQAGAMSNTATVTIQVLPVNHAPTAVGDAYTIAEDGTLAIGAPGVLANDSDPDSGDVLRAYVVTGPTNGALTLDTDGSFTYVPAPNWYGTDSFTYKASDGRADSNAATVTITVSPVNDAPVASDGTASTNEDVPVGIVLEATDVEGSALTYAVVAGPSHGTLSGTAPGLTYTPAPNYSGSDSFTFRANDGLADSNVATVSVTVTPVNDAPVASDGTASTNEDVPVGIVLEATDVEGSALTYAVVAGPSHGTLSGTAPGLTYTPAPNYNGTDSFTFRANDGTADSNVATVTITVGAVNDAPTVPQGLTASAGPSTVTLQWSPSTDPDGDLAGYNVYRSTAAGGTYTKVNSTPVPASPFLDTGLANDITYYYVVTAVDATGAESATSDEVFATPSDTLYDAYVAAPPVVTYGTVTGGIDGTTVAGDSVVQTIVEVPNGTSGMASLQAEYSLHTTANADDVTVLALHLASTWTNLDAADPLVVRIWDNVTSGGTWQTITADVADGLFEPASAPGNYIDASGNIRVQFTDTGKIRKEVKDTLTVDLLYAHVSSAPPSAPPVAAGDSYVATEDTQLVVDEVAGVLANDTDPDTATLTAVLVDGPAAGALVLNDDGSFTYQPDPNASGVDTFTYRASDGTSSSAVATVTIEVSEVNDKAVAVADGPYSTPQGSSLVVSAPGVLANDTDVEHDPLSAVLFENVAHGTLTLNANGSFTYMPNTGYTGPDSFTYVANDGTDDSEPATVTITVTRVNASPVATGDAYVTNEDATLSVTALLGVLANDTDADGDPLTAVLVTDAAHGTLALSASGAFTYAPDPNFSGPDSFTYVANDGIASSAPATVTITVNSVNDAPVAAADAYETSQDTPLTAVAPGVLGNDVDPDGTALTAVPGTGPSHGALALNLDGSFTYTPAAGYTGPDSFTYTASDGTLSSGAATVTITVTGGSQSISVADIAVSLVPAGKNMKAEARVTVSPAIAGAVVSVAWTFNGAPQTTAQGTTDANGVAVVSSAPVKVRSGDVFAVTVTGIAALSYTYDPAGNLETTDSIAVP